MFYLCACLVLTSMQICADYMKSLMQYLHLFRDY